MLPLQQAYEVKHSILEYLKATFNFKDKNVQEAFYNFINHTEEGIFKGPYVSLKLPFVKAHEQDLIPMEIKPDFPPYDHQYKSFHRLHTASQHKPESTLITTGTSSGKTECFMYPVLDYCYKQQERRGIKVIILYPMNALATDQAKRLAETIWNDDRLKGKVTAGLFIGEGKQRKEYPKSMGAEHVIENRNSILDSPPDILLTNFKMLDYALMRHNYHQLWAYNLQDPSLLQFLVLDELHTYDGAQGTDVANLIRRLKLKLQIPKGQVCAVGTSATMGEGEESRQLLTTYAEKIFGEKFNEGAIIGEKRVSLDDFFNEDAQLEYYIPRQIGLEESRLRENETYEHYIKRQKRLWQLPENINEVQLGNELKKLKLVKDIVAISTEKIISLPLLLSKLADSNHEFKRLPEWDAVNEINPQEEVLQSLLALISEARIGDKKKAPFLYLQIQVWVRELSGVFRVVNEKPIFAWRDKTVTRKEPKALPAYFCRECGASGWLGVKDDNKNHFNPDSVQVYEYFFSHHKNLYLVNTAEHKPIEEYEPTNLINDYIDPVSLALFEKKDDEKYKIIAVRKLKETRARHVCPECNTENTVSIIGTRIATLSSITVSQVLSSDLDPRPDKYRKILAFTNSVQDAAHQAGFVEARNYRFTFRASLQKVINQQTKPVTLPELQEAFISFWKNASDAEGDNNTEAYYYRFFPSDYAGKADLNIDYRNGRNFSELFRKEFDERMRWEIISEFGYNATIGRTLEKTGTSAVMFDASKLGAIYDQIKDWLGQNNLAVIDEKLLLPFVNGILHRIRTRGGIDHEYLSKARTNSLSRWELNWNKDPRHFLNKYFGPSSRFPKVISTIKQPGEILDITYTKTKNWYHSYYTKSFLQAGNATEMVNDFYQKLFEVLVSVGLLSMKATDEAINYSIEPVAVIVENKVNHYLCDTCASVLSVAPSDIFMANLKCLNYSCAGTYEKGPVLRPNYYQLVYNRNRSPRIYAAEHTGVLERGDREFKEKDFKERPHFNSLNTLVATSTLEMGIDIGTLNTAMNNSVPPLTSNFLQRVGRAGRSTGSALIINFAKNRAHDLFYFGEPKDIMEGEIATPGCYLEAKDILFRHFFAYCLDNWTSANSQEHIIPGVLMQLQLLNADLDLPDFLANRIISFIKANETELLDRFTEFYRPDLEDEKVLDKLKTFLLEESFYRRLRNVFLSLQNEYKYIQEKRKDIDKIIKENKLAATDEERKILEGEKKALWGLKRLIDKRSILEHLTNVGMLPNYAFPETGVTLNAWVKSNKAKSSDGIPSDKQFEIVRASSTAIREFAPDNSFYSQGYKFAITGLNTFSWTEAGVLLRKRFCSNCDHLENSSISHEVNCPKCGDASWSSAKNQHVFVKLNSVKSVNNRDKSKLDDSSEERDDIFYRISKHIKFKPDSFQGAWGMKEIPFGIEYVKNVTITEVNLGLTKVNNANKIIINKLEDVPCHGFVTCKYCGKSTSKLHVTDYKFHYGFCKHKDKEYEAYSDDVFEEVYLFREIKTEALKVLLPVQEFESDAQVNMFMAGLQLGLKKYYKGNPQHLGFLQYAEFNTKNSRFDRYLVIYDVIPGGTGYLEKLFSPAEFTDVIKKAYDAIRECSCQQQGKDGCYRCIFTYSNQHYQEELSRQKAEILFKRIVDKSQAWEMFTSGLGTLSGSGQIEESELEDRFVRSLRNYLEQKNSPDHNFEKFIEDGVINYKFKITSATYSYYYILRPQYDLGLSQGVRFRTRADFFISLVAIDKDGLPVDDDHLRESAKSIALYMDGYTFHASKEHNRFVNDVHKRMAIVESGDKISWTLTWNDLEKFDAVEKENDTSSKPIKQDELFVDPVLFRKAIESYKKIPYWAHFKSILIEKKNSFERLLWLLENPLSKDKVPEKIALMLSLRQVVFGTPSVDLENIERVMNDTSRPIDQKAIAAKQQNGEFYIFPLLPSVSLIGSLKTAVRLSDLQVVSSLYLSPSEADIDKNQWENFWITFNMIQFDNKLISETIPIAGEETSSVTGDNKYNCLQYYDNEIHDFIRSLIDHNIHFDKEGSFFLDELTSWPEAALGFREQKLFLHAISDEARLKFMEAGYTEIDPLDFKIETLKL
ncbi:MAG: DEAD/DEAH box helicase [Opitutaceae bacterium]|nr:DEAD/DEAH box helicase [Cytophagales bacterium]